MAQFSRPSNNQSTHPVQSQHSPTSRPRRVTKHASCQEMKYFHLPICPKKGSKKTRQIRGCLCFPEPECYFLLRSLIQSNLQFSPQIKIIRSCTAQPSPSQASQGSAPEPTRSFVSSCAAGKASSTAVRSQPSFPPDTPKPSQKSRQPNGKMTKQ